MSCLCSSPHRLRSHWDRACSRNRIQAIAVLADRRTLGPPPRRIDASPDNALHRMDRHTRRVNQFPFWSYSEFDRRPFFRAGCEPGIILLTSEFPNAFPKTVRHHLRHSGRHCGPLLKTAPCRPRHRQAGLSVTAMPPWPDPPCLGNEFAAAERRHRTDSEAGCRHTRPTELLLLPSENIDA